MSAKYFFIFAATIAISSAQSEKPVPSVLDDVPLPPELAGQVDAKEIEAVQTQALNEFKSRCDKNGGPDAYAKAQNASTDFGQCVSRLVNASALKQEVEDAKPQGNVDEVFKKYCEKKPQFEHCIQNFTDTSSACFSEKEQGHLKTVYNVSLQLAEFICFKEGDRIALFIAEGGQECFQDKQEKLRDCANKTLNLGEDFNMNSLANATISFDEQQCAQMLELQTCVVKVLEACPKPTSANIVESLFNFIRKSTPCKEFIKDEKTKARSQKAETQKDGATTFYVTTATLMTALVATVLV